MPSGRDEVDATGSSGDMRIRGFAMAASRLPDEDGERANVKVNEMLRLCA